MIFFFVILFSKRVTSGEHGFMFIRDYFDSHQYISLRSVCISTFDVGNLLEKLIYHICSPIANPLFFFIHNGC